MKTNLFGSWREIAQLSLQAFVPWMKMLREAHGRTTKMFPTLWAGASGGPVTDLNASQPEDGDSHGSARCHRKMLLTAETKQKTWVSSTTFLKHKEHLQAKIMAEFETTKSASWSFRLLSAGGNPKAAPHLASTENVCLLLPMARD